MKKILPQITKFLLVLLLLPHSNFSMEPKDYSRKRKLKDPTYSNAKRFRNNNVESLRRRFDYYLTYNEKKNIDDLIDQHPSFLNDPHIARYIQPFVQQAGYAANQKLSFSTKCRLLGAFLENVKICHINILTEDNWQTIFFFLEQDQEPYWKTFIFVSQDWKKRADENLKKLRFGLDISSPNHSAGWDCEVLADISKFSKLEHLSLATNIKSLNRLTQLKSLDIWQYGNVQNTIEGLTNLTDLRLDCYDIIDQKLETLSALTNLQTFYIQGSYNATFNIFASLTNLTHLNYTSPLDPDAPKLQDEHIQHLTNLKKLEGNLYSLTDSGVSHLTNLTHRLNL